MSDQAFPFAPIPMKVIGPILFKGPVVEGEHHMPLATFETPLWNSVNRGARLSVLSGGISTLITQRQMTRSLAFECDSAAKTLDFSKKIEGLTTTFESLVTQTSRYAQFRQLHCHQVGRLLFIRISIDAKDASGHNMATKAADAICQYILQHFEDVQYVSMSGNLCCDKKTSSVNALLGRGRHTIAEIVVPGQWCRKRLRAQPQKIVDLHIKKNLIGGHVAGSTQSANAHFANMLLATYLATGQDAANIVEGSQGIVHAEVQNDDLYFSVTLPNLIVGTVGNGKHLPFVKSNLKLLGLDQTREPGVNSDRLAGLIAGTVLCGELSLLAALTQPQELMRAHQLLERHQAK